MNSSKKSMEPQKTEEMVTLIKAEENTSSSQESISINGADEAKPSPLLEASESLNCASTETNKSSEVVEDVTKKINELSLGSENIQKEKNDIAYTGKAIIIEKYRSVAMKGKESQAMMLTEPEIHKFLVLCLMDDSPKIIENALEVFEILVRQRRNHSTLRKLQYLLDTLRNISKNAKLSTETRKIGSKILQTLVETKAPLGEHSNSTRNTDVNPQSLNTTTTQRKRQRQSEYVSKPRAKQSTGRMTTLFLQDSVLQQFYVRTRISNELIKVPGIISVTYDLNKSHCIIRGKRHVSSEIFAIAVANLGYEVFLVHRNEGKEEILIPISADKKDTSGLQENLPEYFPEEDEHVFVDEKTAVRNNYKKEEENKTFFGSAVNFVKSSFYW